MSNADIRGRFVWHELMTTDTKAAGAFYPKLTSWKTQSWEKDPSYTMWTGAQGPFGGIRALSDAARAAGAHWLPYIGVPDVDAGARSAQTLGGRVVMGATDIPDAGRFAILADPQGAIFAIFSAPAAASGGGASMPHEFSWHELATLDPIGALHFYSDLFGWSEVAAHDMGAMGIYHLVGLSGVATIGIFKPGPERPMPPAWLSYVHVTDIDKSANAAQAAGGRLLNGPMEVPGGTWIAHMLDPQGAPFALHADKRLATSAPRSQPAKKTAPSKSPGAPTAAKPQPAAKTPVSAAPTSTAPAKPQAPATVSAPAKKSAGKKSSAKKAPAKKAAARKSAAKKKAVAKKPAAKKSAGKKPTARKGPKAKSKTVAKRATRKAAIKRKAGKKRAKSKPRSAPGSFEVARRFAAKQAGTLLKRLRGKKRR